jgi:hypothetical protein
VLQSLGADAETGILPPDLLVIQVGDLVHKGPGSAGCLAVVDRFLHASRGRWVQLIGNHEPQYLGGFPVAPALQEGLKYDLQRWFSSDQMQMAAAIDTVELGPVLVTHSGLTKGKWLALGGPETAADAARLRNLEMHANPSEAFAPGKMLERQGEPGGCVGRGVR